MDLLVLACLVFLAVHRAFQVRRSAAVLLQVSGESSCLGVYSLFSFGLLGGMIYGYVQKPPWILYGSQASSHTRLQRFSCRLLR